MSAQPTISVFVPTNQNEADIAAVKNIFSGSGAISGQTVNMKVVRPPTVPAGWDADYAAVIDIFKQADPNTYVIYCKDTSISGSTPGYILDALNAAIMSGQQSGNNWDLFYLSKWLDQCDQYTNVRDIGTTGMKLVDTGSPNGMQCLMFSPQGRRKFLDAFPPEDTTASDGSPIKANPVMGRPLGQVLNSRIDSRVAPGATDATRPVSMQRFLAASVYPNLVVFDITKRKSDDELLKTTECRSVPKAQATQNKPSSSMGVFWFILIVIVVIIIGVALARMGSVYTASAVPAAVGATAATGLAAPAAAASAFGSPLAAPLVSVSGVNPAIVSVPLP